MAKVTWNVTADAGTARVVRVDGRDGAYKTKALAEAAALEKQAELDSKRKPVKPKCLQCSNPGRTVYLAGHFCANICALQWAQGLDLLPADSKRNKASFEAAVQHAEALLTPVVWNGLERRWEGEAAKAAPPAPKAARRAAQPRSPRRTQTPEQAAAQAEEAARIDADLGAALEEQAQQERGGLDAQIEHVLENALGDAALEAVLEGAA